MYWIDKSLNHLGKMQIYENPFFSIEVMAVGLGFKWWIVAISKKIIKDLVEHGCTKDHQRSSKMVVKSLDHMTTFPFEKPNTLYSYK